VAIDKRGILDLAFQRFLHNFAKENKRKIKEKGRSLKERN
jgi:hypothetical protein